MIILFKLLVEYIRRKLFFTLFTIYSRYLLGGSFVFASIIKIKGERFTTADGSSAPVNSWLHFFETMHQSGMYWKCIGVFQLVSGFLLMTQKYALVGNLIFLSIILNVFLITVSYSFVGTPYITGLMLLASIYLLVWDYKRLQPLLNRDYSYQCEALAENNKIWVITGFIIFITTAAFRMDSYNLLAWFFACATEGLIGFLIFKQSARCK